MAILLLLLLIVGVGAPLLALPRPGLGEKSVYIGLVAGLVVALGASMLGFAWSSWRELRKPLPSGVVSWESMLSEDEVERFGV
jgi:hypothetical protein